MTGPGVLRLGSEGEAVRDLQRRLAEADQPSADEAGRFGSSTGAAVRAFQEARGIHVDGICGPETWAALVESGFRLGDRLLFLRSPNLRGDDVIDLQRRLNALGFDAGREDGILGPATTAALKEFQRNAGISVDGIAGPATTTAMGRLGSPSEGSVAAVRERDELRDPRRLEGHRIYLCVAPGFEALGEAVDRALTGARAQTLRDGTGEDDSTVAGRANQYEADLFLAVRAGDRPGSRSLYYSSGKFRSEAGYRIARAIQEELADVLPPADDPATCGRSYTALRETRMAAIVCELVHEADPDAMACLVGAVPGVARALATGVRRGIEEPPTEDATPPVSS